MSYQFRFVLIPSLNTPLYGCHFSSTLRGGQIAENPCGFEASKNHSIIYDGISQSYFPMKFCIKCDAWINHIRMMSWMQIISWPSMRVPSNEATLCVFANCRMVVTIQIFSYWCHPWIDVSRKS